MEDKEALQRRIRTLAAIAYASGACGTMKLTLPLEGGATMEVNIMMPDTAFTHADKWGACVVQFPEWMTGQQAAPDSSQGEK